MKKIITTAVSAACLFCAATAHATVYKLDFAASGFLPNTAVSSAPTPQDPVTGSIVFTADSLGSEVTSIDAIDLMINGHAYTVDEIGGANAGLNSYAFGGKFKGVGGMSSGTNDFYLLTGPYYGFMSYSVAGSRGFWDSDSIASTFTEQTAAVPEPGSLALLLAGAGGLGAMLRRRRV